MAEASEEITPQSLRVLVTHALLAAEWFPHLHTEVREAAPTAPTCAYMSQHSPPELGSSLKNRAGKSTKPGWCIMKTTGSQ